MDLQHCHENDHGPRGGRRHYPGNFDQDGDQTFHFRFEERRFSNMALPHRCQPCDQYEEAQI